MPTIEEELAALMQGQAGQQGQNPMIQALQNVANKQRGAMQMPMPTREGPAEPMMEMQQTMPQMQERPRPPYNTPGVRSGPPEPNTDNKTTEGDLQRVYDQMDYMAGDEVDTDQDEWPETPQEFERKYGRPPATDAEMQFYYGDEDDDTVQQGNPNNTSNEDRNIERKFK